ncbi:MAG: CinA family nicotinamide mononucleotide deamidase-related protein [Planctomycetota bacterium]
MSKDRISGSDRKPSASKQLRVGVLTVGDEILEGRIVDLHSRTTSSLLTPLGIEISWHMSVGDAAGLLSSALSSWSSTVDMVVVAGGLGPTEDDRSRDELATAGAVDLEFDESLWQRICARLQKAGVEPAENNRNQAYRPEGSEFLENEWGTAPGIQQQLPGGALVFALPGVPYEFQQMLKKYVLPWAETQSSSSGTNEILEFVGVAESILDEWIVAERAGQTDHHICVKNWGQIEVRLPPGESLIENAVDRFGASFVGEGGVGAEYHLVAAARAAGVTISTAESCTGGMIGGRITDVPGSSDIYPGGWICYSYAAKSQELDVDPQVIESEGAVSSEVVKMMAEGARHKSGSDVAIAISGIAGPGGATEEKPVGTVWMAIAGEDETRTHCYHLQGSRDRIRQLSSNLAILVLLAVIRQQEIPGWSTTRS